MTLKAVSRAGSTLLVAIALSSCVGYSFTPSESTIAALDYGSPIDQQDAERGARSYFQKALKDPYSAVFEFGLVGPSYVAEPIANGGKLHHGYILDVTVNAKNSFGGFTGAVPHKLVFKDAKLITVLQQKPGPYWFPIAAF